MDIEQMDTTTEAMGPTPTLLGLPLELFQRIAEFSTKKDLRSLRTVSRDCSSKVLKPYQTSVVSDLEVMLSSSSSIRHAIEVVEHPSFGAAVRRLVLIDNSLPDPHRHGWDGELARQAVAAFRKQVSRRDQEEKLRLLTNLFAKCGVLGFALNMHLKAYNEDVEHGTYLQPLLWIEGSGIWPLRTVSSALVASESSFGNFSTDSTTAEGIDIDPHKHSSSNLKKALDLHFKTLDLVLKATSPNNDYDHDSIHELITAHCRSKIRFLRIVVPPWCTHEHMIEDDARHEPLIEALVCLDFPLLERLSLGPVDVYWEPLLLFFKRHQSLRELRLYFTRFSNVPDDVNTETHALALDELKTRSGLEIVDEDDEATFFAGSAWYY